jgi:hypothetical protein
MITCITSISHISDITNTNNTYIIDTTTITIFTYNTNITMQPPSGEGGSEVTPVQCLPPIAQEVVDEFALRYAIDPIYRMMV